MAKLFEVLAGKSSDTFSIGGVDFFAAPLTIAEWTEMAALGDENAMSLLEFLSAKLQPRIKDPMKHPPADITAAWLEGNLPRSMLDTLQYVLMYGKMPDAEKK